jgi:DNA invertase Pin-like site-specific DNA recombinase
MSPQKTKFLPYYRVSTVMQGRSGLGLEAQRQAVEEFVYRRGGTITAPMSDDDVDIKASGFVEVESGRNNKRPKLAEALAQCEMTGATLVVAKLDRLSRNAAFLMELKDSEVDFVAADLPDANTMTVGIMATVAQYEAEVISARTKVALQASQRRREKARADGDFSVKLLGGYRANAADISKYRDAGEEAAKIKADKSAERCRKAIEHLVRQRKTLQQMAEYLNEKGIQTPRSKKNRIDPNLSISFKWYPQTVKRVIERLKIERPAAT